MSSLAAAFLPAHSFPWIHDQVRLPDRSVRERHRPRLRVREHDRLRTARAQLPPVRPAAVARFVELHLERRTDVPPVVFRTRQHTLDPRRSDLEDVPSLDQVLSLQVPPDLLVPVSAVLEGHPGRAVHQNTDHRRARLRGEFQIPEVERLFFEEGPEPPGQVLPQFVTFQTSRPPARPRAGAEKVRVDPGPTRTPEPTRSGGADQGL